MGGKCSPYQSNSTIKYHLKHLIETAEDPSVVKASQNLMRTMYIDDIVTSFETENEAIKMREMITNIFEGMGMKATKFVSNSQKVLSSIPRNDLGPFIEKEGNDHKILTSAPTKILGIGYIPGR